MPEPLATTVALGNEDVGNEHRVLGRAGARGRRTPT